MSTAVLTSGTLVGTRELISELGGDPHLLADEAGLTARLFEEPDIFVQADRIVDFFELAATACRCPDFGLRHASRLPTGIFWQIWTGMRTSENLRAALDKYVHLYGLYTDGASCRRELDGEHVWLHFSIAPLGRWGSAQLLNLTLGHLCLFIGENLGRKWRPRRVLLRIEPDDPKPFTDFFGNGVSFGQEHDAVLIDRDILRAPMALGNAPRIERSATSVHKTIKGPVVIAQARALLATLLRHDHCSVASIAQALGLSQRTFQRRLCETDTTFRELVDAVRADLAWRHVERTDLSIGLVSDLLGYNSHTAFSRAFRRWHGVNPRAVRRGESSRPGDQGVGDK